MPVVKNGAELVKLLKESGTKDNRLAPARECLKRVKAKSGVIASAAQVVAALVEAYGEDHMTVVKAKSIARTGEWKKVSPEKTVPIEDELLGVGAMSDNQNDLSSKADRAGNKAADDREPGSGDYDPVKAAGEYGTTEKAEAEAKAAAEGGNRPGGNPQAGAAPAVTDATEPPAADKDAAKPKVQKAMQTRETKAVEKHHKNDHKGE